MPNQKNESITIEVAYASPECEVVLSLMVPRGTTAGEAIRHCGILQRVPEIDLMKNKIGVYSKLVSPDYVLHPFDRIEIYRPLIADPKEIRRLRAGKPARPPK